MSSPRFKTRVAVIVVFAVLFSLPSLIAAAQATARHSHGSIKGDLADALGAVAIQMQVPIIAELALPLPRGFDIPPGEDSVDELLSVLLKTSPGYSWQRRGRVVHFYNRRLLKATANFLNMNLESSTLPGNVAELHDILRRSLFDCSVPRRQSQLCPYKLGGVVEGHYPIELEPLRLPRRKFPSTAARQVLLDAADANGEFYSIVVFPRAAAETPEDAEYAFYNWAWLSLSDKSRPFSTPFPSRYERVFQMSSDELFRNLIAPSVKRRQELPSLGASYVELWITVDKLGTVKRVSAGKGDALAAERARAAVLDWRFKPYYLNRLPTELKSEITVEVEKDGSVTPITPNSCGH